MRFQFDGEEFFWGRDLLGRNVDFVWMYPSFTFVTTLL